MSMSAGFTVEEIREFGHAYQVQPFGQRMSWLAGQMEIWREADSSIPVGTQRGLATLEWIHRAENLAIAGPSVIHGF